MKKIMQALALVLLAAAIVFAAAQQDYKNNETCHGEWKKYRSAVDQLAVGQSATDSVKD